MAMSLKKQKVEKVAPPKDVTFKIKLRVYGKTFNASNSHSYLVDDVNSGTSSSIAELNLVLAQHEDH